MAKHDTLTILDGFLATADSGRATINSRVIATIEPGAEEAAETIVAAFNSHDEMLEALSELVAEFDATNNEMMERNEGYFRDTGGISLARIILAKWGA